MKILRVKIVHQINKKGKNQSITSRPKKNGRSRFQRCINAPSKFSYKLRLRNITIKSLNLTLLSYIFLSKSLQKNQLLRSIYLEYINKPI